MVAAKLVLMIPFLGLLVLLGFPVALEFDVDGRAIPGRENLRTAPALSAAFAELRGRRGRALRGEHLIVRKKLPVEGDAVTVELDRLEKLSGAERKAGLSALSTQLHKDAVAAADSPRAHAMAAEVGRLAAGQP
jgi:hypothetical protein